MALSYLVIPGVLTARPITFIDSIEWENLIVLGLFNIFDTIGRTLGGLGSLMISIDKTHFLHILAFSRILIVIMAIMIEVGVFSDNTSVQNWLIILNPIVLAVTNGYVQTISACYSATLVSRTNANDRHA